MSCTTRDCAMSCVQPDGSCHGCQLADLRTRLATAERERDEAVAWQKAKQEWIDVATRTLQAQLDATTKLTTERDEARGKLAVAEGERDRAKHERSYIMHAVAVAAESDAFLPAEATLFTEEKATLSAVRHLRRKLAVAVEALAYAERHMPMMSPQFFAMKDALARIRGDQ